MMQPQAAGLGSVLTSSTEIRDQPRIVVLSAKGLPDPYNLPDIAAFADVTVTDAHELPDSIPGAHVLLLWDYFSPVLQSAWPLADRLEWIHVLHAVGMKVTGVGRTARENDPDFGKVLSSDDLERFVGEADHVIAVHRSRTQHGD